VAGWVAKDTRKDTTLSYSHKIDSFVRLHAVAWRRPQCIIHYYIRTSQGYSIFSEFNTLSNGGSLGSDSCI